MTACRAIARTPSSLSPRAARAILGRQCAMAKSVARRTPSFGSYRTRSATDGLSGSRPPIAKRRMAGLSSRSRISRIGGSASGRAQVRALSARSRSRTRASRSRSRPNNIAMPLSRIVILSRRLVYPHSLSWFVAATDALILTIMDV